MLYVQHVLRWRNVAPTCWPYDGPTSKLTLGQRSLSTLGQRSGQPKYSVGPTLSCYLGTKFRQIENRLNSMESQLLNNLYMQNQMTLQNQMNLQSLFHCQNQLITGLVDRQQNPYVRKVPISGFQHHNQAFHPKGYSHITSGPVRPPSMFHVSASS